MTTDNTSKAAPNLGTVLVTGGSGFVGKNFVKTLLDRGLKVKSFDLIPSDLNHENLEIITGNICDEAIVEEACKGVDTVFHTAAIIYLNGGRSVTKEQRDRSYAINVEGTKSLLRHLQKAGGKRFIYTASNSVILQGEPIRNGKETEPYTNRFNDLYTETKVVAEKWILEQDGKEGVYTASIRPSGIWGPGDQTVFRRFFEQVIAGSFLARVGLGSPKLDNSFVHNLIHGQILAAERLVEGGVACGQAYFINDGEPINMFDFAEPILAACGEKTPKITVPGALVKFIMNIWQELHFKFNLPEPPVPPLAVERLASDNYFSIEKAQNDLGYEPLYTTEEGTEYSLDFYKSMFASMKEEAEK